MNPKNIIIVTLFAILCVYIITIYISNTFVKRKLREMFLKEQYNQYLEYLKKPFVKFLLKDYEIEDLKYHVYLKTNNYKMIDEYFDNLLSRKVDKNIMLQYQIKAFYYYMKAEKVDKCANLYDSIVSYDDESVTKQINYLYKVVVLKDKTLTNELLAEIENEPKNPFYVYVLSESYKNNGDNKKYKKYKQLYKDNMSN